MLLDAGEIVPVRMLRLAWFGQLMAESAELESEEKAFVKRGAMGRYLTLLLKLELHTTLLGERDAAVAEQCWTADWARRKDKLKGSTTIGRIITTLCHIRVAIACPPIDSPGHVGSDVISPASSVGSWPIQGVLAKAGQRDRPFFSKSSLQSCLAIWSTLKKTSQKKSCITRKPQHQRVMWTPIHSKPLLQTWKQCFVLPFQLQDAPRLQPRWTPFWLIQLIAAMISVLCSPACPNLP